MREMWNIRLFLLESQVTVLCLRILSLFIPDFVV